MDVILSGAAFRPGGAKDLYESNSSNDLTISQLPVHIFFSRNFL